MDECVWDTRMRVRISEAKYLPLAAGGGGGGGGGGGLGSSLSASSAASSGCFCRLQVDDETLARTATKWGTDTPFFGEEFNLALANHFRLFTVVVHSQDAVGKDHPVGRIDLTREELFSATSQETERWYPIMKIAPNTVFTGEVFVELMMSLTADGLTQLQVTVVKARDVLPKNVTTRCDPYCAVKLGPTTEKTPVVKNCRCPLWDVAYTFEFDTLPETLTVALLDDTRSHNDNFLGQAEVDLTKLERDVRYPRWLRMRPRFEDFEENVAGNGSIRISLSLTHELYMPLSCYEMTMQFIDNAIQEDNDMEQGFLGLIHSLIQDNPKAIDRDTLSRALMMLLSKRGSALYCVSHLVKAEIAATADVATLFRGNSLASKCIDNLMRIVALPYLHKTIKPTIDCIFAERRDCEIDPDKYGKKPGEAVLRKRGAELSRYLNMLLTDIYTSVDRCPQILRNVMAEVQRLAKESHLVEKDKEVGYIAVSSFIFLRFFAPAVLSPHLFGMREDLADVKTARTLTLLAKSLQTVGNLGAAFLQGKETYMDVIKQPVFEHIAEVTKFIDALCSPTPGMLDRRVSRNSMNAELETDLLSAKLPVMEPGARSFSKLHVTLTDARIKWARNAKMTSFDSVDLSQIVNVEQVEANALDRKNVLQVVARTLTVYLALPNANEMEIWLQAIRGKLRRFSSNIRASCHSGILKQGVWTCCHAQEARAAPCSKAHFSCAIDNEVTAMTEAEAAHSLYTLLLSAEKLISKKFGVTHADVVDGEESIRGTAATLLSRLLTLNLEHLLLSKPVPEVDPVDLRDRPGVPSV